MMLERESQRLEEDEESFVHRVLEHHVTVKENIVLNGCKL